MSIQQLWEREQCPIVNGIVFANGKVKPVDANQQLKGKSGRHISFVQGPETTLATLEKTQRLMLTFYTELASTTDASRDLRVVCGEAAMGGDGFVALLYQQSGELIWFAFFDTANPFATVRFDSDSVVATNNLGEIWAFPIADPSRIAILSTSENKNVSGQDF